MTPYHLYKRKSGGGFTVVELVIIVAISVFACIGLVNLFLTFNALYGYQRAFLATAASASTAMGALEAATAPAEQVLASRVFSGTTYTSATTTLVLQLPAVNASGNIIAGTKDYVVFFLATTTLYRLTEAGAGSVRPSGLKKLSTTVALLAFTYNDPDAMKATVVTADLTTQAAFKREVAQSRLRERLRLRNL